MPRQNIQRNHREPDLCKFSTNLVLCIKANMTWHLQDEKSKDLFIGLGRDWSEC